MHRTVIKNSLCIVILLYGSILSAADNAAGEIDSVHNKDAEAIPNAPTNLQVLEADFDYIFLSWDDNSDNEDNFIIERHETGFEFEEFDTLNANSTSYLDWRTESGTDYYYRIKAVNTDGVSDYSNEVMGTTLSLNEPPAAPTNLSGTVTDYDVFLSWTDNSDNELQFLIYRGTSADTITYLAAVNANVTEYSDRNLEEDVTYFYYVLASNNNGYSESTDTVSFTIVISHPPELLPPVVNILEVTSGSISVSWNSSEDTTVFYDIEMISENNDTILETNYYDTVWTRNELPSNTTYNILVSSNDTLGNREEGNLIEFRTLPWFADQRVTDSLVSLYSFTEINGNTIQDISGTGNLENLYIEDSTGITRNANFLKLSNTSIRSVVATDKITDACKLTDEITIECWLKSSLVSPDYNATIMSLENDSSVAFSLNSTIDMYDPSKFRYYINVSTVTTSDQGKPDFVIEESLDTALLHHLIYTHDNLGNEKIYINGKLVQEGFRSSGYNSWTQNYKLTIGNSLSGNNPWHGSIYLCSVYNRAFTESEVSINYMASPFTNAEYIINSPDYSISFGPNPASDQFLIIFEQPEESSEISENYYIEIVDNKGFVIIHENVSGNLASGYLELNASGMPEGIYTVILFNEHERIAYNKLIILH